MDTSKHLIPFWEETLTTVLDLSNGEIYDVFDRDTQTQFAVHRTWWNSNLTMDKFMPTFMPAFPGEGIELKDHYELFADRFLQRNLTHKTPLRPGVLLTHGLVVYGENGIYCGSFVRTSEGDFKYMQTDMSGEARNDPHYAFEFSDPDRTSIIRISGYTYWNGVSHV